MNSINKNSNETLKDKLIKTIGLNTLNNYNLPNYIQDNLRHKLRDYQKEALALFSYYLNNDFDFKEKPIQLLFNMATGSGKTLVMASLMLEAYKQGYRNFIFFVNSTTIINKTLDNFLNTSSSKCLFKEELFIDGKRVNIKQVDNFNSNIGEDINIIFTTIHSLHSKLQEETENSFGLDDIARYKVVLLADEAHHLSSNTKKSAHKQGDLLEPSWEDSISKIMNSSTDNLLLEFSATIDFDDMAILEKYKNRTIYDYGLRAFYEKGYSKDINLLQIGLEEELEIENSKLINTNTNLMLVAILVNLYRECIAMDNNIRPFKPVILFKAQKTIDESKQNYNNFNNLINTLTQEKLENILDIMLNQHSIHSNQSNHILSLVVHYFKKTFSTNQLVEIIKDRFKIQNIIDVNYEGKSEDKKKADTKNNQLINTLELPDNNIRAIFAVNKLNEGWDVLNLYDVVRLYNSRDANYKEGLKVGSTTMAEAQLIGRGARYYPFMLNNAKEDEVNFEENDFEDINDKIDTKYIRKFDQDLNNPLRILETMYYFSCKNVKYISELKAALISMGLEHYKEEKVIKTIKVKDELLNDEIFNNAKIYLNYIEKKPVTQNFLDLLDDSTQTDNESYVNITENINWKKDFIFSIGNEVSKEYNIIKEDIVFEQNKDRVKTIFINEIDDNILKNALLYFPSDYNSKYFLQQLKQQEIAINFKGNFKDVSNDNIFKALLEYFSKISKHIKVDAKQGSTRFKEHILVNKLKTPRSISISKAEENSFDNLARDVSNNESFVYDGLYIDSDLEVQLYESFKDFYNQYLKGNYDKVYLIRNHLEFPLYTFKEGDKFYPDFILILKSKLKDIETYQVILEAKGEHIKDSQNNIAKANFLKDIVKYNKDKKYKKKITFNSSTFNIKLCALDFFTQPDNAYFNDLKKQLLE